MPSYIVYKNDAFNIYTTVADGFYFETGITEKELYDYIKSDQGEQGVVTLPNRINRAKEQGSSSLLGHTFEDLAGCNVERLSVQECIDKYMTVPKLIADADKDWVPPMSEKEALRICVAQLKDVVGNENVYDDERGKSISFKDLERMIK